MAYSAINWTLAHGRQGPVRVERSGRYRLIHVYRRPTGLWTSSTSVAMIGMNLVNGTVAFRRVGAVGLKQKNIFNRFLRLIAAKRYGVTLVKGHLYLRDKIRKTNTLIPGEDGIRFKVPTICVFHAMKPITYVDSFGAMAGRWIEDHEERNRQDAAQ